MDAATKFKFCAQAVIYCLQIKNHARMQQVSHNIFPCINSPQLHNALSNENVKWYFHDNAYNGEFGILMSGGLTKVDL